MDRRPELRVCCNTRLLLVPLPRKAAGPSCDILVAVPVVPVVPTEAVPLVSVWFGVPAGSCCCCCSIIHKDDSEDAATTETTNRKDNSVDRFIILILSPYMVGKLCVCVCVVLVWVCRDI